MLRALCTEIQLYFNSEMHLHSPNKELHKQCHIHSRMETRQIDNVIQFVIPRYQSTDMSHRTAYGSDHLHWYFIVLELHLLQVSYNSEELVLL